MFLVSPLAAAAVVVEAETDCRSSKRCCGQWSAVPGELAPAPATRRITSSKHDAGNFRTGIIEAGARAAQLRSAASSSSSFIAVVTVVVVRSRLRSMRACELLSLSWPP